MKIRFRWYQFWRPRYPRFCRQCYQVAALDEGGWLEHKLWHWRTGGSIEARFAALKEEVKVVHQHAHDLMDQRDAMFGTPPKEKLN